MTGSFTRLRDRLYKPRTDPHRVRRIHDDYDRHRGYAEYGRICRAACRREPVAQDDDSLATLGFSYLKLIDSGVAQALSEQIQADSELLNIKKNDRRLKGFRVTDQRRIHAILKTLITAEADARFLNYFKSEYLAHSLTFTLTPQARRQPVVSFRWHCDKGPSAHLKMIVYLNATLEHGGSTAFIDLADTASVAARGYVFGGSRARTDDTQWLSQFAGRPLREHRRPMAAGDAVIFQPGLVLHRGVSPPSGHRFVITLCLLPSPIHWEEALENGALIDLTASDKWHRHADTLLEQLNWTGCPAP